MDAGSIEETLATLKRWCLRPGHGMVRVGWDSALARERVIDRLRSALNDAGVSFGELELPAGKSAGEVALEFLGKLTDLTGGVVSITGIEWAYPEGGRLNETLGALSFYREKLAALSLRQIWWMPEHIAEKFVLAVPDFESWFRLRLHLQEVLLPESPEPLAACWTPPISTAEATQLADQLAERIRSAEAQGVPKDRIWAELGRPLLRVLEQGGLNHDKVRWLSRFAAYRSFLELRLETLRTEKGEDDTEVLAVAEDLADLLNEQGDLAGAGQLYRRILEARQRRLGPEAPESLSAMLRLSRTLANQGALSEARPLLERAVEGFERGPAGDRSALMQAKSLLGLTLKRQGDLAGARKLQEEAVEIARRMLGANHSKTLGMMMNLANTMESQGDRAAARRLKQQVLETQIRELGVNHPDTLLSMQNLAVSMAKDGDRDSAAGLEEKVLASRSRTLGNRHPLTVVSAANLLATYLAQHAMDKARSVFHRNLEWLLHEDPSSLPAQQLELRRELSDLLPSLTEDTPETRSGG